MNPNYEQHRNPVFHSAETEGMYHELAIGIEKSPEIVAFQEQEHDNLDGNGNFFESNYEEPEAVSEFGGSEEAEYDFGNVVGLLSLECEPVFILTCLYRAIWISILKQTWHSATMHRQTGIARINGLILTAL